MNSESLNYEALYARYSLGKRLGLVMNHAVLRVIGWVVLAAIVLELWPFAMGILSQGDGTEVATLVMGTVFWLIFTSPFIVMVFVLINIFTDRAVKSDRIKNFAYANGFSYQQFIRDNFGVVNPFWEEGRSYGYQDTVTGAVNGKGFWVSGMMHFTEAGFGKRSRVYYSVVCALSGVDEARMAPLIEMYKGSEVKTIDGTVYISFPQGISYKPKDYQKFFETLSEVSK